MKPTANFGAGTPFSSHPDEPPFGADDAVDMSVELPENAEHNPDATALLKRYLAEIHSFREMGNQALRNLEARLATMPDQGELPRGEAGEAGEAPARAASQIVRPSLPKAEDRPREPEPSLTQRLNELSAYLHADLSRVLEEPAAAAPAPAGSPAAQAPVPQAVPPQPPVQVRGPLQVQPRIEVLAPQAVRPQSRVPQRPVQQAAPQSAPAQPQVPAHAPQQSAPQTAQPQAQIPMQPPAQAPQAAQQPAGPRPEARVATPAQPQAQIPAQPQAPQIALQPAGPRPEARAATPVQPQTQIPAQPQTQAPQIAQQPAGPRPAAPAQPQVQILMQPQAQAPQNPPQPAGPSPEARAAAPAQPQAQIPQVATPQPAARQATPQAQPPIRMRVPQQVQVHVPPRGPQGQPQPQIEIRAPQPEAGAQQAQQHKSPSAPVLDRAWFEERFALLRTSIDKVADDVPLKRIEALEAQFRGLMERLTAREEARDSRPMEASLKQLASYLADNRQWQEASNQRMKGVEERLDRLSDLVAQSNAAISATAQGLEIVAKGTGENLVRATAGVIVAKLGEKIDRADPSERFNALDRQIAGLVESNAAGRLDQIGQQVAQLAQNDQGKRLDQLTQFVARLAQNDPAKRLEVIGQHVAQLAQSNAPERIEQLGRDVAAIAQSNPAERLEQLGREVANLSAQSRIISRSTEDRLGQIETVLKEKPRPAPAPSRGKYAPKDRSSHQELESYLNRQPADSDEDYDSDMIAAAQRAARLADGPSRSASSRGRARYQIPYGDFLPDEDSPASRAGLIVAVAILLLAGAIMVFVKVKEWTLGDPQPAAMLEHRPAEPIPSTARSGRQPRAALDLEAMSAPIVTGSTPAAPPLSAKPLQLWVAAKAPDAASEPARPAAQPAASDGSFRQAAVQGDAKAQYSVGQSYLAGDGDLTDGDRLSAAARWFRRAAESGHAPSQYRLAKLYEIGRGAPRDVAEAETWYGRAAAQGHVGAMHSLAMLAASTNRRSANYLTAAKWFAEAAAYGLVESQFNLGILCENGLGTPKNLAEAYFWYSVAARQKDGKSMQKRDDVGRLLSPAERQIADRRVATWTPKAKVEEVNRIAPEPPVAMDSENKPALPNPAPTTPPTSSTAVMRAAWKGDVASTIKTSGTPAMIAEAQRLLAQRGYQPGPADGVAGPRTQAAIRSFQAKAGLEQTGEVSEALIVKMAFLPI